MAKRSKRIERRSTGASGETARPAPEFAPDYGYVRADLRRIAILAGGLLMLLLLLSLVVD
jgi:hypothetical protein